MKPYETLISNPQFILIVLRHKVSSSGKFACGKPEKTVSIKIVTTFFCKCNLVQYNLPKKLKPAKSTAKTTTALQQFYKRNVLARCVNYFVTVGTTF